MNRDQLAELLHDVNVVEIARLANVSVKTIYRLRHKKHAATLDTVERIVKAAELAKKKPAPAGPAKAA